MEKLQNVKQRFGIIGMSEGVNRSIEKSLRVAPTDISVLVTGESGVGKENIPKIIHQFSHRKHSKYIAVNCGAIPEGTIDSELFGHEKGAFTGATSTRKGYFEVADSGTIFLDEVGELPMATQVRLLRVLETGEFIKVGSSIVQKTNVRIVAATNLDMSQAIEKGKFREDLFHRLAVIEIKIPTLSERKSDIKILSTYFIEQISNEQGLSKKKITKEAITALENYPWSGNIRELRNVIERYIIIGEKYIEEENISNEEITDQNVISLPLKNARKIFEKNYLQSQINRFDGNISKTATFIGMERSALHRKLKQLGITEDFKK